MTTYTEPLRPLEFLIYEEPVLSRDTITIVSGAGVVSPGTVLGKITASGKYKPYDDSYTDGAETADAINFYEIDATSADVKTTAITRFAVVKNSSLQWNSLCDNTAKAAAIVGLANKMIVARS